MPLYAPEEMVAKVARMEKVENKFGGYQVEIELEDPNPDTGNPRIWLSIPESGRITARTVFGWWLGITGEVERRIDGLDFRTAPKTLKSIALLCQWMVGQWYLWETQQPPIRKRKKSDDSQDPNERRVPVRKFKSEEEAHTYYNETAIGDLSDDGDDDIPLGVPQDVIDAAMTIYKSAEGTGVGKGEAIIRQLASTQWPSVDEDELVAALKEQAS